MKRQRRRSWGERKSGAIKRFGETTNKSNRKIEEGKKVVKERLNPMKMRRGEGEGEDEEVEERGVN